MTDFRRVTDRLSVSAQITPADLADARAKGFVTVINNRPDGEAPDQAGGAEIEAAAKAAGLAYFENPVRGMPSVEQAAEQRRIVDASPGPVLAFCRSGNRSILAWSIGERLAGWDRDELIKIGADAGYDLSGALPG